MDTIEFKLDKFDFTLGVQNDVVSMLINQKHLLEIIKEYELPFASREGYENLAGGYSYLDKCDFKNLFLNANLDESVVLLGCPCGTYKCWYLEAKLKFEEDIVTLCEFKNRQRRDWIYDISFKFDKKQFENELANIKNLLISEPCDEERKLNSPCKEARV